METKFAILVFDEKTREFSITEFETDLKWLLR
jgi:hypothetical protein